MLEETTESIFNIILNNANYKRKYSLALIEYFDKNGIKVAERKMDEPQKFLIEKGVLRGNN